MPRLEKFLRRRNKPRLLESLKLGGTLTKLADSIIAQRCGRRCHPDSGDRRDVKTIRKLSLSD
jgi:hypothetical protein